MKKWLASLFHPSPPSPASAEAVTISPGAPAETSQSGEVLALQKEVQALRLELDTRQRTVENLRQEVERLRLRQEQVVAETVEARLGSLFGDLAGPASQILTQADLIERQERPVQARDVLSVARRMVRALERYGVAFIGKPGEQVAFDPNHHTPINASLVPEAGQPVTVRFAEVTYQGKTIYKAIVE